MERGLQLARSKQKHAFECEWRPRTSFLFSLEVFRNLASESAELILFRIGEIGCTAVVLEVEIYLAKSLRKTMLSGDSGY